MDKSPLEQHNIDITAEKNAMRASLGRAFDDKLDLNMLIDEESLKLDFYQKNGFLVNKEEILNGLKKGAEIKNRNEFIDYLVQAYEPVLLFKKANEKLVDKIMREYTIGEDKDKRLSEVLYYDLGENDVRLHLSPARDFMTKDKIEEFNKDIEAGLIKLAEIIKPLNNIEKITATSWIVAIPGSARRLEKMGFTIEGEISKDIKEKYFKEEDRVVASAFMKREDFLARYEAKN